MGVAGWCAFVALPFDHLVFVNTLLEGVLFGGDEEDRTPDLRIANATLSQLSYVPIGPAL